MHSEPDCCIFRLKRSPTNFYCDPARLPGTGCPPPRAQDVKTCTHQPLGRPPTPQPKGLTTKKINTAAYTQQAKPRAASSLNGSVCGSTGSHVSSRSLADVAGSAAQQHAHQTRGPHTANSTWAGPHVGPSLLGESAIRHAAARPSATHRAMTSADASLTPHCAMDHLSGTGACVRPPPGAVTRARPATRCRANQQHVFLFAGQAQQAPLSASAKEAAARAAQPPWRSSSDAVVSECRSTAVSSPPVSLAAFVRGEAGERGPTPAVPPPSCTRPQPVIADDASHHTAARIATSTAGASAQSVNRLYGTGTRLETSAFSSASLDGRGTTAALLRERHGTARAEATAAVSLSEPTNCSRVRYLETMQGHGRLW